MLHYFKFHQDLFDPVPARDVYIKRKPGRGWPEECPPIRAANGFGFDVLANFDVTFVQSRGAWKVKPDIVIESDFNYAATDDSEGSPLVQQYAWFWQKGQKLPHVITDNVYREIRNQVKISTFLYMSSARNEVLMMTDIPNLPRPWKAMTALIETDWYPASYPWHAVIELDPSVKRISIKRGEPLCRIIPLRRGEYHAAQMSHRQFDRFFARGQEWLARHGRFSDAGDGSADITRTYVKQQSRSRFVVNKP